MIEDYASQVPQSLAHSHNTPNPIVNRMLCSYQHLVREDRHVALHAELRDRVKYIR